VAASETRCGVSQPQDPNAAVGRQAYLKHRTLASCVDASCFESSAQLLLDRFREVLFLLATERDDRNLKTQSGARGRAMTHEPSGDHSSGG
jgi:hypothetical protein